MQPCPVSNTNPMQREGELPQHCIIDTDQSHAFLQPQTASTSSNQLQAPEAAWP